jgi:hypothetical protein
MLTPNGTQAHPVYSASGHVPRRGRAISALGALLLSMACAGAQASGDESGSNADASGAAGEATDESNVGPDSGMQGNDDANAESSLDASVNNVENVRVSGFAQKGPFLNGATLTLSELNVGLAPTGRTFQTTIVDDTGAFAFQNVTLDNSIAAIRVDGFYFNEVLGSQSTSQITLSAITDLAARDSANINLVSHLEKARVEYLIGSGSTYAAAKTQALTEVFAAFSQQFALSEGVSVSEELDLTQPGVNNAGLLAISSILLGYRADASFSETLANVAGDLRVDGTLDSASVLSSLVSHARTLDAEQIRMHLTERYEQLGQVVNVPPFEAALTGFVDSHAAVPQVTLFDYPEGSLLADLFAGTDGMVLSEARYEMVVNKAGAPMQTVLTSLDGGIWYYALGGSGFLVSDFDYTGCTQTYELTVLDAKSSVDLEFSGGVYRIDVYEGSLTNVAWSREFSVGAPHVGGCGGAPGVKDEEPRGSGTGATNAPTGPGSNDSWDSSSWGSTEAASSMEQPPADDLPDPPASHQPPSNQPPAVEELPPDDEPTAESTASTQDASAAAQEPVGEVPDASAPVNDAG